MIHPYYNKGSTSPLSAIFIALGIIIGAWILGAQFKNFKQNSVITVKGVAEEVFLSKEAHWQVGIEKRAATYATAIEESKKNLPKLITFLKENGFSEQDYTIYNPEIEPYYEDRYDQRNNHERVQNGYTLSQNINVHSKDLAKIEEINRKIIEYRAQLNIITFEAPKYYLDNLDAIKQSMIAKATQDAHLRAEEFAKSGKVKVGSIKSASQGSFNILANTYSNDDTDSYGGQYSTSTAYKRVRLVVTIQYNIEE